MSTHIYMFSNEAFLQYTFLCEKLENNSTLVEKKNGLIWSYSQINPFNPELLKWTLPSLKLAIH